MKRRRKKDKNNNGAFYFIGIIIVLMFTIIIVKLYQTMYLKQDYYLEQLNKLTNVITTKNSAPRGRIYDRNYNLLVDNKAVPTIYYKKEKGIKDDEEIELAYKLSKVLELDYDKVTDDHLKVFYKKLHPKEVDAKITNEEREKVKARKLTNDDLEILKLSRITLDDLSVFNEDDKKASYLYYLMNRGYLYDEKTIKSGNVTINEEAYIAENIQKLKGFSIKNDWERIYLYGDTFRSILGNVSSSNQGLPKEEVDDYLRLGYSLTDRVGISYLEKQYEPLLLGRKALYKVKSRYELELLEEGSRGNDIVLTIDINLQQQVDRILEEEILLAKTRPNTKFYNRSFVVLQDPKTGEVLAMSGKQAIRTGNGYQIIDYTPGILTNPMTVGSVVKGASILVGYNNGIIDIGEYQLDECIKILNTPKKCSWKTLGRINDIDALALSSNVYQFKIAMKLGGANYVYDGPLQIKKEAFDIYRNTYAEFGLGVKTGIDLPVESLGYKGNSELPGHLLDFAMGQYDTYTPIQLSQYISTLANGGNRIKPHLLKEVHGSSADSTIGPLLETVEPIILNKVNTEEKYLNRVKEGLYVTVNANYGLGKLYMDSKYRPAGKTGTSESFMDTNGDGVIDTETISTSFVGFAPVDNPSMSIVVTSPDVSYPNSKNNYMTMVTRSISYRVTDAYFNLKKS